MSNEAAILRDVDALVDAGQARWMDENEVSCDVCRRTGVVGCCREAVRCNFRARLRLGIPYHVCIEAKARDLELSAIGLENAAARERGAALRARRAPPAHSRVYREYLASPQWGMRRSQALAAAGWRCEGSDCGRSASDLEVHHLDYRRLGRERSEDLLVLCPPCHRQRDDERWRVRGRRG